MAEKLTHESFDKAIAEELEKLTKQQPNIMARLRSVGRKLRR
ncbi:hypothetical protein LCGC14_0514080 [marine sediment metagenome]|uniref:Uncharacterized protein n=1 Tax=marine sediment metagenome TaxID=412755 RepID=A0A0F9UM67_9ZZZZ